MDWLDLAGLTLDLRREELRDAAGRRIELRRTDREIPHLPIAMRIQSLKKTRPRAACHRTALQDVTPSKIRHAGATEVLAPL